MLFIFYIACLLENQVEHTDKSHKKARQQKPGACIEYLIEFITYVTENCYRAAKLNPKTKPSGIFLLFVVLLRTVYHLYKDLLYLLRNLDTFTFYASILMFAFSIRKINWYIVYPVRKFYNILTLPKRQGFF